MGTRIPLSKAEIAAKDLKRKLEMSTAEIGLTVRTTNCLEERGIFTVRDLLERKPKELLSISNFGEKTLEEVYKALEKHGFYRPWRRKDEPESYCENDGSADQCESAEAAESAATLTLS